ncbi:GNAT family N-acetyltransferase [Pseudolysinimonas sp.]|uniref:GNAT family N-acetyltransferase n=1 Tax=Pseudolysinimonas sp. TaxID=2680009 RepID=UPI003F7F84A6
MEDVSIRAGLASDEGRCVELWVRAVAHRDGVTEEAVRHRAETKLARRNRVLLVLYDVAGDIRGYSLTFLPGDGAAHLSQLAIDPDFQGAGHGHRLLVATMEHPALKPRKMTLRVLADNLPARTLYERLGWIAADKGSFSDSGHPWVGYSLPERM